MTNTPIKTYELLEARLKREKTQCSKLLRGLKLDLIETEDFYEIRDLCENMLENIQRLSDIDYILNGVWED